MYTTLVRIRQFEEQCADLVSSKEIRCPTHLYLGQEAVATGVCAALRREDYIFGTHRSHGHYLAKGAPMNPLMAEIFCKSTGCSRGRGGSMHLVAPEFGILGTSPIVAAGLPLSLGTALVSHLKKNDRVTAVFFGDGAVEEGTTCECLNFAALKKLPLIFVCENNFYSSHLKLGDRQPKDNIFERAIAHGMPGIRVDGNNVLDVYHHTQDAVERARLGEGPSFLECRTYRWRGHVGANWDLELGIRTKEELEVWMERCPVKSFRSYLLQEGIANEGDLMKIDDAVLREVVEAVHFARQSPYPSSTEIMEHVFV